MYVYEQYTNRQPACEWIADDKVIDEIQTQLDDIATGCGMIGAFVIYEDQLDEQDEDDYVKAEYQAVKDYADNGGVFPATVVTFPGQLPEQTYQVWSDEEAADLSNWEDLLDEWTAFSNEYNYGVRPYFFTDDKAPAEWVEAWKTKDYRKANVIAKAADLKPFVTRDREAGNVIDEFADLDDAKDAVASYEDEDRKNGDYTVNFYEVYNQLTNEIID